MSDPNVIIAGGGIGGLTLALTLEQVGVSFTLLESAREIRPLGVGIILQPNAVRELFDLGFTQADLDRVGVQMREWALVGRGGQEIHAEPRGLEAGYRWPQYAVHRGRFQMMLYEALVARAGAQVVRTGARVTGYAQDDAGVTATVETAEGETRVRGGLLVGADGIHSAVRRRMHPAQPPAHWGGTVMWRGTTRAAPVRTGASFLGLGGARQRLVMFPISPADDDGLAEINWVAEVTRDDSDERDTGWFRRVPVAEVLRYFEDWRFGWLDVPAMLRGAEVVYENPMIDQDPLRSWVRGRVGLLGDAAHAMYPTGANGASQAIVDARVLGASLLANGVSEEALEAYDQELSGPVARLVLRNREAGPLGLLDLVEERCGGVFGDIDQVIPKAERAAFVAGYNEAAGLERAALNAAPPTIPPDAGFR